MISVTWLSLENIQKYQLTVPTTEPFLIVLSTTANLPCKPSDPRTVSVKDCTLCSSVINTVMRICSTVSDAIFAYK